MRGGFFGSALLVAVAMAAASNHLSPAQASSAQAATSRAARPVTTTSARPAPGSASQRPSATTRVSASPSLTDPSPIVLPSPAQASVTPVPPTPSPEPPPPASETPQPPEPAPPVAVPAPAPAPPAPAPPAPPGSVLHLTFDDGPDPTWTPQVLSVLAKHNAHATFFVLGRAAGAHPGLVADERAAGHSVGNHTTTHPDLTKLSVADITSQWQRTANVIGGTPCARPPYGAVNATVRQVTTGLGYRVQLWDIDTRDWSRPGADVITQRIVDGARPGAVVLLHDGGNDRSQTVAALDAALTRLDAAGWRYEAIPGC